MRGHPNDFWGKLDARDPANIEWHPLVDHCTDVAATFEALLSLPLARKRLAALGGLEDLLPAQVQRLSCFVFLHDLGKLSLGFQAKAWNDSPFPRSGHVSAVAGLFSSRLRATMVEALRWREICRWTCSPDVAEALLLAAFAHHGEPVNLEEAKQKIDHRHWRPAKGLDPAAGLKSLGDRMLAVFPEAFAAEAPKLPDAAPFQHAFAGLVTLADWIGSHRHFFPFTEAGDPERIGFARKQAQAVLQRLGLDMERTRSRPARATFTQLFGHETPNPLQQAADTIEAKATSTLTIFEAETGSGKTEAAILHFRRLLEAGEVDGLYFALPTRAAATQIYTRITNAVRAAFGSGDDAPPVVLALPGYASVDGIEGRILPAFEVLWPDREAERLRYRGWASENPKRFLAAPIAVGTIDQALLGVLRVRHAHLRSASILRHLVVVDEVHASDPYMEALLARLLAYISQAGGHVLLMSATLGSAARERFLNGRHSEPPPLETAIAMPYPYIHRRAGGKYSPTRLRPRQPRKSEESLPTKAVTLRPDPIMDEAHKVAALAVEAAQAGARVLVLRNTVGAAVETQREVEAIVSPGQGVLFSCQGVAAPHHARFAREDRALLDAALEERFGKNSSAGSCVAVTTQTAEQSLDIDADLIITDLCPMDVLLQRLGRLHRHRRVDRPQLFAAPLCRILVPADRDLARHLKPRHGVSSKGLGTIYADLRIIEATWRLIEQRAVIEIPHDNRALVEGATHPQVLENISAQSARWREHGSKMDGIRAAERSVARLNAIDFAVPFNSCDILFESSGQEVKTRLGEDDRLVIFPERSIGPFGKAVRMLTLPAWMCRDVPAAAEVREVRAADGRISFRYGDSAFVYDRWGARSL